MFPLPVEKIPRLVSLFCAGSFHITARPIEVYHPEFLLEIVREAIPLNVLSFLAIEGYVDGNKNKGLQQVVEWHPHIHLVIQCSNDQAERIGAALSARIASNVDVRPVDGQSHSVQLFTKYFTKQGETSLHYFQKANTAPPPHIMPMKGQNVPVVPSSMERSTLPPVVELVLFKRLFLIMVDPVVVVDLVVVRMVNCAIRPP